MTHITSRSWTDDDLMRLKTLVSEKATPLRAAAILKRSMISVQVKARELGAPFPKRKRHSPSTWSRSNAARETLG